MFFISTIVFKGTMGTHKKLLDTSIETLYERSQFQDNRNVRLTKFPLFHAL